MLVLQTDENHLADIGSFCQPEHSCNYIVHLSYYFKKNFNFCIVEGDYDTLKARRNLV